jgi:hypothetical protein
MEPDEDVSEEDIQIAFEILSAQDTRREEQEKRLMEETQRNRDFWLKFFGLTEESEAVPVVEENDGGM